MATIRELSQTLYALKGRAYADVFDQLVTMLADAFDASPVALQISQTSAALRAVSPADAALRGTALKMGRTAAGDGGARTYRWTSGSTAPDDGEAVIAPAAGGAGRWLAVSPEIDLAGRLLQSSAGGSAKTMAAWAADIQTALAGVSAQRIARQTLALLAADLAWPANTLAEVTNDALAANNGTYIKLGASGAGSWQQASFDRVSVVEGRVSEVETDLTGMVGTIREEPGATQYSWALTDKDGNIGAHISADGATFSSIPFTASYIESEDFSFAFADKHGFIGFALRADGSTVSDAADTAAFSPREIAERNARALSLSSALRAQYQDDVQRPVFGVNHVLAYGQSLSTGHEGWPAKTTASFDNLMLGNSVHAQSENDANWVPIGGASLQPLKGTVKSGTGLLDAAGQAALAAGAGNLGETVLEGALSYWRKAALDDRGLTADPTRRFLASSCGVSGRIIEELSKGASPELFNRLRMCATAAKGAATAAGLTYGIAGVLFLQGEYNYWPGHGGAMDKATYKSLLRQLIADIRADVQVGIAGQSRPCGVYSYQTGAGYTNGDDIAIGMAQWEAAQEERAWYLVAPYYPIVDKNGHLSSNGYRWLGQQMGKVMHRVLSRGENWRPLSPLSATLRGRQLLLDFHVPVPPLVWGTPYVANTPTDYPGKGFLVVDEAGSMIPAPEIVGDAVVRLTLPRDPVGAVSVRYAGQTSYAGNGCLRDSDPAVAANNYEYAAGSGDYAAHNIAALVGKPYPLWNWCIAFNIGASEG